MLPVGFPVRVHTWVVGSVPGQGACGRKLINVSFSHWFSLPLVLPPFPLSINKYIHTYIFKKVKTTQFIIGRVQTYRDLTSKSVLLTAVLNCLLIGLWQAGKFKCIPEGQLLLSSLVLGKNGGLLLPELLTFQEKLEVMGYFYGARSSLRSHQFAMLGLSLSLSLDCKHIGGRDCVCSSSLYAALTKHLAQNI